MRDKGQVELIALAGIALLVLGVIAYFMFFRPVPRLADLQVKLAPIKNTVCPMDSAKFLLYITNPKENPPVTVKLNITVKPEGTAWLDFGNGMAVAGGKVVLKPGETVTVKVYGIGGNTGEHVINVTIVYTANRMSKVMYLNIPFLVVPCG